MHTTYKTVKGDNYAKISRKVFGTEQDAALIRRSNPGIYEPIPVGLDILCPAPDDTPVLIAAGAVDELSILILGERFHFWDSVTVKHSIDSVDTVELTAPFDPDSADFKRYFRPFSYNPISCFVGSELIFTGTMVAVKPNVNDRGRAVAVGGYSLPGVLEDCCAPASMFAEDETLEFADVTLKYIATELLKPFGLRPVFYASEGAAFEQVSVKAAEEIMPFLAKLAKQRNLVITSSVKGEIVFWQSNQGGDPVAKLYGDLSPVLSIDPDFKTQDYYSHITGVDFTGMSADGEQHTEVNTRLKGVLRPKTFEASDAEGENLTVATKAKMGRMFGDAISYNVELDTWRDSYGALWRPNTTLILHAPDVMIYKPYEFLIRDVEFRRNSSGGGVATLSLVLPCAYRGDTPKEMPWDF